MADGVCVSNVVDTILVTKADVSRGITFEVIGTIGLRIAVVLTRTGDEDDGDGDGGSNVVVLAETSLIVIDDVDVVLAVVANIVVVVCVDTRWWKSGDDSGCLAHTKQ